MIGTITVNPSIDQHILIDKLVKDDAIRAKDIARYPGGKGINVSRAVKLLGGETIAFGVAGGCGGYMLRSLMTEQGIDFYATEVLQETRINVILTDQSDRTQTRISAAGPRMTLEQIKQFIHKLLEHQPFPEWWVLGGSLPPGVPNDLYAELVIALQKRGAKCVLDADDEALQIGVQAKPYMIKPNEYELARLAGRSLSDETAMLKAAQEILHSGVQIVAVTLGRRGALIVSAERTCRTASPDVVVKTKVGAGDSFLAGFVLMLSSGQSLEDAIRLGMAAGTAAVMNEGTTLCRKEDVDRLVGQIRIEPVASAPVEVHQVRGDLVQDVVCGMKIDPRATSYRALYREETYRFCSMKCQKDFQENPQRYADRKGVSR